MLDLVLTLGVECGFGGIFITHDLTEAARLAHRIAALDRHGRGIIGSLTPPGAPAQRSDVQVFAFVDHPQREDLVLADLINVDERALPLDCACDTLGFRLCC